jgi:hypothetical protein
MKVAQPTINRSASPSYFSNADPNLFYEMVQAVQQGEVFPSPIDVDTKTPEASPLQGKQNDVKTGS